MWDSLTTTIGKLSTKPNYSNKPPYRDPYVRWCERTAQGANYLIPVSPTRFSVFREGLYTLVLYKYVSAIAIWTAVLGVDKGMARGKTLSVVFKANHQHQMMAFPPSLDELIAAGHPVRVVHEVLEKVDITALLQQYKPGGTSSYHPRMLLKALVYAYINNIYSSRKIEEALQESIYFMWLTGMSKPDHNTINRFRGQRLQKTL